MGDKLRVYKLKMIGSPTKLLFKRANEGFEQIGPFLIPGANIIDIGSGGNHVAKILLDQGYKVTPLDIKNNSRLKDVPTEVFDGVSIPYSDKSFDIALLLTVLHHAEDSVQLLREAARVAKRVIIIEDIYHNEFQKHKTHIIDNILNFDFFPGHHANRYDYEWKELFEKEGLKLIGTDYWRTNIGPTFIYQSLYCIEAIV